MFPELTGPCVREGAAGTALLKDDQRLQTPLIRVGERGSGNWKAVSWDEALDYTAGKLKAVINEHGGRSLVFAERTQLSTHVSKTFTKALGSPNHCTHDSLCKGIGQHGLPEPVRLYGRPNGH